MNITNIEIAGVALCSEAAVRGAAERQKLNLFSLESVVGFILAMRMKQLGIGGIDDLKPPSTQGTLAPIPMQANPSGFAGVQRGCAGIGASAESGVDEYIVDTTDSQEVPWEVA